MVEFSEDFTERATGVSAVSQRVLYRLMPRVGEIPYFRGGLDIEEFSCRNNLAVNLRYLLSDFNAEVSVSDGRVMVGDVSVPLPGGIS